MRDKLPGNNGNSNVLLANEQQHKIRPKPESGSGGAVAEKIGIQLVQLPAQLPASKSHLMGFGVLSLLLLLLLPVTFGRRTHANTRARLPFT